MELPAALIQSLEGISNFDRDAFIRCHASGTAPTSIRINQFKLSTEESQRLFNEHSREKVPWASEAWYLGKRPSFTFDPLFHAGAYYVQEASGMFVEQVLRQTIDLAQPLKVLDLCAAPGGKSTLVQSLISADSLLVTNEVIRSRAAILKDNIVKWGRSNAIVTSNDPADFSVLPGYFDVILVDAPCSGSGLFRKDEEAINEWSVAAVDLCSRRQQRILEDIWPSLKEGGILIYCTCSYSPEEDETISSWMLNEFLADSLTLNLDPDWKITEVDLDNGGKGYRFWPYELEGEGFYLAVVQKKEEPDEGLRKFRDKKERTGKAEAHELSKWIRLEGMELIRNGSQLYAWPMGFSNEFDRLLNSLRVIYSGTLLGEWMRDKLIPAHQLAMSGLLLEEISGIELTREEAISYLQRKNVNWVTPKKGWQLARYEEKNLGWVNALANRINNYYPKEMRILKEKDIL